MQKISSFGLDILANGESDRDLAESLAALLSVFLPGVLKQAGDRSYFYSMDG
jgi:hypothetical protein